MPNPFFCGENARPNGESTRPNGENTRPRALTISHNGIFFPGTALFGKHGKNSSVFEQRQSTIWKIQVSNNPFVRVYSSLMRFTVGSMFQYRGLRFDPYPNERLGIVLVFMVSVRFG